MNGQCFTVAVKETMKVNTFMVSVKEPRKGSRLPACRQVTYRSIDGTYTLTFYAKLACENFMNKLLTDGYTQVN